MTNQSSSSTLKSQKGGLNGVATFVRKNYTIKADSKPFNQSILDCEGRCLLTDHGSFVVINIYVPNSGQNHKRYPFKMKFLSSLQTLVAAQKVLGKKVILVGDFNIAPSSIDVCRPNRQMHIPSILTFALKSELAYWSPNESSDDKKPLETSPQLYSVTRGRWLAKDKLQQLLSAVAWLRRQWPGIEQSLQLGLEVVCDGTRFRVMATRDSDGKKVRVGGPITSSPSNPYSLAAQDVTDEATGTVFPLRTSGYLYCADLQDCTRALSTNNAPVDTDNNILPTLSDVAVSAITSCGLDLSVQLPYLQSSHWDLLSDVFGEPAHVRSCVQWFHQLLQSEDLVDSFACAYPSRQGRFTCWEQHSNRRYCNDGSRIDHILLDRDLWLTHGACLCPAPLPGFDESPISAAVASTTDISDSVETITPEQLQYTASLRACTADGRFQPAPFDGGGIPSAPAIAHEAQFRPPSTSIVYTPPEYSDHAGVSLYLCSSLAHSIDSQSPTSLSVWQLEPQVLQRTDAGTKLSQPHFRHTSIMAHFKRKPEGEVNPMIVSSSIASVILSSTTKSFPAVEVVTQPPAKKVASTDSTVVIVIDDNEEINGSSSATTGTPASKPGKITSFFKK